MDNTAMTKQELVSLITRQVTSYNENLDNPVDLSAGEGTLLFGAGAVLASVDFVTLVLDIEEAVEEATGTSITLADERAMSQKHSPFRTVGTLADYISELLEA